MREAKGLICWAIRLDFARRTRKTRLAFIIGHARIHSVENNSLMSAFKTLQQAIALIQKGNLRQGARLLRTIIDDPALTGDQRALAYIWLAETTDNNQKKQACYNRALEVDPGNQHAQQRLTQLMLPPTPPPTLPEAPVTSPPPNPVYRPPGVSIPNPTAPPPPETLPQSQPRMTDSQLIPVTSFQVPEPRNLRTAYHIVGVMGGPNGTGSGFFVAQSGILVTTRFVVGDQQHVTVELETGRQLPGRVVRAYPYMDTAFVYVEQEVPDLLPMSPYPTIMEGTQLSVISYKQQMMSGKRRETGRAMAAHWFPTDIVLAQLPDAGGGPVFDERGYVVGMITRNISSNAAYVFGVPIAAIRNQLESFFSEMRAAANRIYCVSCGYVSKAAANGGYYCESCGTVMPHAQNSPRIRTPQTGILYEENNPERCIRCSATVGIYQGHCLRCGAAQAAGYNTP
jgi:serine protease Do